jgi:phenylalanyl-tRNA synthetase beta chain
MKVPLGWLKEFVAVEADFTEIARRMTMAGLEVESVERVMAQFSGVVVGRVLKVQRHPNADRLTICDVDAGASGQFSVVCGAPNVRKGMKAPFAIVGARLAASGHENEPPPPLEAAVIRGVRSEGMLCSERELGFSDEHTGIMALERNAPLGADLSQYMQLEDVVFDIWVSPNRGDCLSVLGIAREVAALFEARFKEPKLHIPSASGAFADGISTDPASGTSAARESAAPEGHRTAPFLVDILAPDLCPHYAALRMEGIKVGVSPIWLRRRLELCAMRPLNNIVDVTNYVMLERGQPLHAFDLARIAGGRILVRKAGDYFEFLSIDSVRREIEPTDLMIADGTKPLAIAGVMGGRNCEVSESTTAILLESAYFDPPAIARTSRRLGIRSEASARFERGIDRGGQVPALARAAMLIGKLAGGREVDGIIDAEPSPQARREIDLDPASIEAILGIEISAGEVRRRLRALGAEVAAGEGKRLRISPPLFRPDLSEAADLAEEVARLKGLEEIPAMLPLREARTAHENSRRTFFRQSREVLVGCGLTEVKTIAFVAPADNEHFPGLGTAPVKVVNPLSAELSELRLSLVSGLVAAMRFNLNRQADAFHAFEIGKVFAMRGTAPGEDERIAAISYGDFAPSAVGARAVKAGFFSLKGALETYFQSLGLFKQIEFVRAGAAFAKFLHPGRAASIKLGDAPIGYLGELHPREAMRLELAAPCAVCELDIENLIAYGLPRKSIEAPPRFPAVRRDLALVIDREFPAYNVVKAVEQIGSQCLESVTLFDVYEGEPIPAGKKSVALALNYRAKDRTLTDEEVNGEHAALISQALIRLGAELRQ